MGHKPFWVIADDLARRGIASLRYDDRGFGESEGIHMGSTIEDFAGDLAAAATFLATQPRIDPDAIGIVGHSEGGMTGPQAALLNPDIDFLVLLAPPGEPLVALLQRQGRDGLRVQGIADSTIEKMLAAQADDLELMLDETLDTEALRAKLQAATEERFEGFSEAELSRLQLTEATIEQGIQQGVTPYFRSLVRQEPAVHLQQIKIPTLALFAEKDIQVAADVNAAILEQALEKASNEDFQVRILPGLNHLFQHAETGSVAEYQHIEETFAPEALELIGEWITTRYAGPEEG